MQKKARVRLTTSWSESCRLLPQRLVVAVEPYLQLPSGVPADMILFPIFEFDATDPLLTEFVEALEKESSEKGRFKLFRRPFGKPVEPLLQQLFYFSVYEIADLLEYEFVQIAPSHTLALKRPFSQYYRAQIKWPSDCESCGQVELTQTTNLQIDEEWPDGCFMAETDNYEFLITDTLKKIWQNSLPTEDISFQQVETNSNNSEQIWQVVPKHIFPINAPSATVQVVDHCSQCQRPLIITIQGSTLNNPSHQTESFLHSYHPNNPSGNFWKTELLQGRLRLPRTLLEKHTDDPEPSFVRTARPFWIASRQLLKQFQQHSIQDWIGKPILVTE